jgi:hypothetical protein
LVDYVFRGREREQGLATVKAMRDHLGTATRAVKMALERGLIVAKEDKWDGGYQAGPD